MRFRDHDDDEDYDVQTPIEVTLDSFFNRSLISEVLFELKSGKEATVYCCRAHPATGAELYAAKVYRDSSSRNFKNDAIYREGRPILDKRLARAFAKKTDTWRSAKFGSWVHFEWETINELHAAGADVPVPVAFTDGAILMEYIGDAEQVAQPLNLVLLPEAEARPLLDRILRNVELLLGCNKVHSDLSPYNVLYHNGQITIIDFPQAVDPRFNPHAFDLLLRDVQNVCRYFDRYGVRTDPERITRHLWNRFRHADL